ncbi:MAG TPA: CopD family protein [Dehalococcoidia bacterium]|nr:CopD family protein [Dehalococcoidia bacterium]
MVEVALVACTWLHLIVLVIWVGHMFSTLLLFTPLASRYVKETDYGDFIAEYRRRDQPVALSCIAIFFITGFVLLLLDDHYERIGSIFANSWSIVLFVKHLLVLAMVGLGIYMGVKVMPELAKASKRLTTENSHKPEMVSTIARLNKTRGAVTQALCGLALLVLLLTAVGEIL